MGCRFFYRFLICSTLIVLTIDSVKSNRAGVTPEFDDGLSKQNNHQNKIQIDKSHLKLNSKNEKQQSGGIQNKFHHSDISDKKLEEVIEHSDRKTLEEWYSHAYGLNDILKSVEASAKRCGCKAMYEPILDSKKRLNHGLSAVSNKLRYGKVYGNH